MKKSALILLGFMGLVCAEISYEPGNNLGGYVVMNSSSYNLTLTFDRIVNGNSSSNSYQLFLRDVYYTDRNYTKVSGQTTYGSDTTVNNQLILREGSVLTLNTMNLTLGMRVLKLSDGVLVFDNSTLKFL